MARLLASFFGTGLILGRVRGSDAGSGTVGGGFGVVLAFSLGEAAGWLWVLVGALVLVVVGTWAASLLPPGTDDAGWIVIDEAAGAFLAVIGLTTWPVALAAFVVFRLADIAKTWFPGVAAAERLPGAAGVMADDLAAGLYGLAFGHIMQALF
jgi:phosphatidylglycerophosphatase A